jgi:ABC-type nitrate/sulfonate/bicarbonate transport system substrate-binding protein
MVALAACAYDATMGIGVLADSPIKGPGDLAGKKIGTVPTSAESPFFPAYAQRAGLDLAKVDLVSVDAKVIERTVSDKQVDAMTGIATTSLPVLLSRNIPVRWMLYSSLGMPTYGNNVVSTQAVIDKDPGLSADIVDGLMESLAYTVTHPDEASDLFFKAVPEAALNAGAKDFIRIGLGLHRYGVAKQEAKTNGLGWGDPKVYEDLTALVMNYNAEPGTKAPSVESWQSNTFAGKIRLSEADWATVEARTGEFGKYLG